MIEPFDNYKYSLKYIKARRDYECDYWKCKTVLKKGKERAVFHFHGTYKTFNICEHCLTQINILGFENVQFKYHKDYSFYITDLNG